MEPLTGLRFKRLLLTGAAGALGRPTTAAHAEAATRAWIQHTVVGERLCPWAVKSEGADDAWPMRVVAVDDDDEKDEKGDEYEYEEE